MESLDRSAIRTLVACAVLCLAGCHGDAPRSGSDDSHERYRRAFERVETALAATLAPSELSRAGGLVLRARGLKFAGAEGQGLHPDSASPGAFQETLAFDGSGERTGYAYRHDRYDGTRERLREVYGPGDRRLIFVLDRGFAVHLASPDHPRARRRLARRLPGLLLAEVRERAVDLRWVTATEDHDVVSATLQDGRTVDLRFDRSDGLLEEVVYLADAPTFGDVSVTWRFDDYRDVDGFGFVPRRYEVRLGDRAFTRMEVSEIELGAEAVARALAPPDGVEVPDAESIGPETDASAGAEVREVAPGVYLALRLRSGFHPMFVEFDDFVVAVDAPAGYPLWDQLPASDVAPGPSSAWLSERFLELIGETLPEKPVRYVVLTHHHNDHAGGVRAFVAAGATVVAAPPTASVVRRAIRAPHTVAPDGLARLERPDSARPEVEVVDGSHTISDGSRVLEVVDVGPNPHTEHMLVVRLPGQGIWFVSDLLDPTRVEAYPKPEHAALDRWFAGWLRGRGEVPERIYTMHGSALVTPDHLAKLEAEPPG